MLEILNREHPEFRDRKEMYQRYWDLYVGGEQLRRNGTLYLIRRQKEPNDVYAERLSRVFYENYLGSCIDWYAATLFRSSPALSFQTSSKATQDFFTQFVKDADHQGMSLLEIVRDVFIRTLIFGESYVLIDFPRVKKTTTTRAEEDALGKSRAYLVPFSPLQLTGWKTDCRGGFEWVLLKTQRSYQESFDQGGLVHETRWTYYDRERFRVYSQKRLDGKGEPPRGHDALEEEVALVDEGRHGLADVGCVPLIKMRVSDGLWLSNKAALLQLEHFNKSNALSWALHMGLFAMPVIYSEREWQQIVGEAYYIQLGPNDRFGWTEPEGHVFQIAADNLDRLKDEIYRVCYLMTQAGGREARHLGQSGASKRRDFAITHEVLRAYGGTIKGFLRRVLDLVRQARQDDVTIELSGMHQFDEPAFSDELENARGLQEVGIQSARFRKEVHKRVALKYLEGASQETKSEVAQEIERQTPS